MMLFKSDFRNNASLTRTWSRTSERERNKRIISKVACESRAN